MLHYHKCNDCLTAFSCAEKKVDYCDCNGEVSYMGEVHGTNYVEHKEKSPCDGRCTHAAGPECDCQCGGANHGTGKVVQVTVVLGKVKAVGLTEQDIERADVFRKLRDYAEEQFSVRYGDALAKAKSGQWIQDRSTYFAMVNARRKLDKIKTMKVYDKRTQELVKFITEMKTA